MPHHRYHANPHQLRVLQSTKPLVFLGGGVGTGKTETGSLWTLHRALQTPPGSLGLICANSYTQLIDATLRNLYRHCERWGVSLQPPTLPASHRPFTLRIGLGHRWVDVLCRSLDAFGFLAGLELAWWWADETWQADPAAIDLLLARLRDPRASHRQALMTTTLDDPASWMYDTFVTRYQEELMEVIYATTYDNAHNLPPEYLPNLRRKYSQPQFERMVLARWVSIESGRIYHAFDRQRHLDAGLAHAPELPLYWSHDFNIAPGKPMSSVIAQMHRRPGPGGRVRPELHVLDEIVMETADTQAVIREYLARGLPRHGVIVCGDAAGRARDSRSGQTDYSLLAASGFPTQLVPPRNPPIRNRHNAVNALLANADGDCRLRLHPRCRNLARGLETVRLRPGSHYEEEESREQHVTTALGYLVAAAFPSTAPAAASLPRFWK